MAGRSVERPSGVWGGQKPVTPVVTLTGTAVRKRLAATAQNFAGHNNTQSLFTGKRMVVSVFRMLNKYEDFNRFFY
jgi:hypothetical protein